MKTHDKNLPEMHLSDCVLVTQPCPAVPEQKDDGHTVLIRVPAVQERRLLLDSGWILNVVPTQCLVAQGGGAAYKMKTREAC